VNATFSDLLDRMSAVHFEFDSGPEASLRQRRHHDDTDHRLLLMPGTTFRNGMPPLKPYVYRGSGQDELTAWMDDLPDETPAPRGRAASSPCGTPAAARRHWRRGEPLDEACRQASCRDRRERAARQSERRAA